MINLIRGATKAFQLKIRGELTGDPHDFTGSTEIVVSFPIANGLFILYKLSTAQLSFPTSPLLGVIAGTILATDSPQFVLGQGQLVTVTETTVSGAVNIYEGQVLNVNA